MAIQKFASEILGFRFAEIAMESDCFASLSNWVSPYEPLFRALSLIPISHYILGLSVALLVFLYNFMEIHFLHDFFTGFRGDGVLLTYSSGSELYRSVASKCRTLHGRYLVTPWLASPHLQTLYIHLQSVFPQLLWWLRDLKYKRQLFRTPDGGTIALDWLMNSNAMDDEKTSKDDKTPIVVVIPGLTSDSDAAYIKHLVAKIASNGWNVVVSNHRGLGGLSLTSDYFYNAGWTEDIRKVIDTLHSQHPEAPLFIVGTSIGANVLVKYLGEEGGHVPIVGAAAVCCPWDILICDRFMNRKLVQQCYNRVLAIGLQGYAKLHESILARLADWDGINKSRSVRDFDNYATRIVGNYETVDTYYRRCSCTSFIGNISVPLLCISALDDPVCTKEAIPWDECRLNENIILASTHHGGHLGYFEGITATNNWWVRAVDEFLVALHSSSYTSKRKKTSTLPTLPESSIDQGPYVNVTEDGMVTAAVNEQTDDITQDTQMARTENNEDKSDTKKDAITEESSSDNKLNQKQNVDENVKTDPVRKCMHQLLGRSQKSIWLLVYIAIVTTWPVVGSALLLVLKKRFRKVLPTSFFRK